MRLWIIFLVVVGWCSPVLAQAKGEVRSGEHDNFSRLVVYLSPNPDWILERESNTYVLKVRGWRTGFDVSSVFDRMPKVRITDVIADAGSLTLKLACECEAVAEPFGQNAIVIDVRRIRSDRPDELTPEEDVFSEFPSLSTATTSRILIDGAQSEATGVPDLTSFRSSIMQELGKSASLSLLQLAAPEQGTGTESPPGDLTVTGSLQPDRLRVRNALDLARSSGGLAQTKETPKSCPNPKHFDLPSWGEEGKFSQQISDLRRLTVGEFDDIRDDDAMALARAYLYFGLGAEARTVVRSFALEGADVSAVQDLAALIERDPGIKLQGMSQFEDCAESLVPWKLLTREVGNVVSTQDTQTFLAQFSGWPKHLKMLIGPQMVARFAHGGQKESAEVLENLILRGEQSTPVALTIIAAQSGDETKGSVEELLRVVEEGGEDAPEALNLLLLKQISNQAYVDPGLLDLAAAFEAELRALPISGALRDTRIRGLAHIGALEEAFLELMGHAEEYSENSSALVSAVSEQIIANGGMSMQVELALWLQAKDRVQDLSAASGTEIVQSLMSFGLPELSSDIFAQIRRQEDSKQLEASIAAARDDYKEAENVLLRSLSSEADEMRADVMVANNQANEAWATLGNSLSDAARGDLAWAASQWASVPAGDLRGTVAQLINQSPVSPSQDRILSDAQIIQENSNKSRAAIRDLLEIQAK